MAVKDAEEWNKWVDKLQAAADIDVMDYTSFMEAVRKRHDYFHENGCRISDHGLDTFYADEYTTEGLHRIFGSLRRGESIGDAEQKRFKSAILYELAVMDAEKDWTQQFHIGAIRNNNSRMFKQLGADTGFDSMGDKPIAGSMSKFFDRLDRKGQLAKTIVYNLNPRDNMLIASMVGNFQQGPKAAKMQWGSAWWFMDQKDGIEQQLNMLSNIGLLSRFVGMLTDSRSFLSYPRHDYFRRILCNLLGNDIEKGLLPDDVAMIGRMVQDISYNNAVNYFGIEV